MSKKLRKYHVEKLPFWLSISDVEYLLDLVQDKGDRMMMAHTLRQLRSRLLDKSEQVREMVARENANGFWEEIKTANAGLLLKLRKGQKLRRKHVKGGIEITLTAQEVNALPPGDMKALLQSEGRLRGKRGGYQPKRPPPES